MPALNNRKEIGYHALIVTLIAMFIVASLCFFMYVNTKRIITQNENYIVDATNLSASHIDNRFFSKLSNIQMIASLYSESMDSPEVDTKRLKELCPPDYFDYFHFIPADGRFLMPDGRTADLTGRESYQKGMRGETGIFTVDGGSLSDDTTLLSFYTPMYYKGRIIGVLCGLYDSHGIQSIISNSFFGVTTGVYLCDRQGRVIVSTGDEDPPQNILELSEDFAPFFGAEGGVSSLSEGQPSRSLSYRKGYRTETACIAALTYNDWVLVQTFPPEISSAMIHTTNNEGILLCSSIILAFFIYILFLLFTKRQNEILLTNEKEEINNIVERVTTVFRRFAVVNLTDNSYYYVAKTDGMPSKGDYTELIEYVSQFYIPDKDEGDTAEIAQALTPQQIQKNLTPDLPYLQYEYHINRGEDRWECLFIICLKREKGKPVSALYAIQDITERKLKDFENRNALQEAFNAAKAANNAKSEFLSRMSHDIRTPMNAVMGMTAVAAMHMDDKAKLTDCLNKISASSRHLLALINDVLDMSKIESGKVSLSEEPFSLSEMTEEVLDILQPQIKAKKQKISMRTSNISHEYLIGDTLRLRQVFVNILGNAVKFTPEEGSISLDISEIPSRVPGKARFEFVFTDTGIGMEQSFIDKIFEPFSRSQNPDSRKTEGTGLGMAIAKNIVTMMNGDIKVESRIGEGSKFTVRVFLAVQETADREDSSLGALRILVADDDPDSAESTKEILTSIGMEASCVYGGREALETIVRCHERGEDFDVVILDWQMPDMDGVQTAAQIRKAIGDSIPIIILSAYDWTDIEQEARNVGVNAFVAKPLFRSRLVYVLRSMVAQTEQPASAQVALIGEDKFSGRRVLLAEDIELNREIAGELLSMNGILVEYAFDGKMAVDTVTQKPAHYYDLIFMDIQMPNMNGYEATRAIRSSGREDLKTIPIIAMSADAFSDDIYKSRESGMNDHISKPIDIPKLMETLEKWLKPE